MVVLFVYEIRITPSGKIHFTEYLPKNKQSMTEIYSLCNLPEDYITFGHDNKTDDRYCPKCIENMTNHHWLLKYPNTKNERVFDISKVLSRFASIQQMRV